MGVQVEFAAVLGVKDERELLPHCMAWLRRIGVERVAAIDCGSSDGSLEWLLAREADELQVHRFSDLDPDAAAWERLNIRLAQSLDARWVLFLDADEFWIPASGHLRDCAGLETFDTLRVHRFNVPLARSGPLPGSGEIPGDAESLSLIVEPVPDFRARLDSDPGLPWIRGVPVPKIMARPEGIGGLADGGHAMSARTGELREGVPADLLIAHLPFTNAARFERKLANIRRVFEVHSDYFGEHLAWHWRRWLALDGADAVREEFQRQAFDGQALEQLRRQGVVMSAADWFRRERARAAA